MPRAKLLQSFINNYYNNFQLQPMRGDASFRKYYRLKTKNNNFVVMDSAPTLENNDNFTKIHQILKNNNIKVPNIYYQQPQHGFFIIEDLGDELFYSKQQPLNLNLYKKAIDVIINMQKITTNDISQYTQEELIREMTIAQDWFYSDFNYSPIFDLLINNIQHHKKVLVHRDYHSKNIIISNKELAIIDFQDAVNGSYAYDLVSLLKDAYIELNDDIRSQLIQYYCDNSRNIVNYDKFITDFDYIGVQRHIKIMGIFMRLYKRDNKKHYRQYIANVKKYLIAMANKYPELRQLKKLCAL